MVTFTDRHRCKGVDVDSVYRETMELAKNALEWERENGKESMLAEAIHDIEAADFEVQAVSLTMHSDDVRHAFKSLLDGLEPVTGKQYKKAFRHVSLYAIELKEGE